MKLICEGNAKIVDYTGQVATGINIDEYHFSDMPPGEIFYADCYFMAISEGEFRARARVAASIVTPKLEKESAVATGSILP